MTEPRTADLQLKPDPLDEAIAANKGQGHRYYAETLEIIRGRLRALEARGQPYHGVAWLIECFYQGSPPDYYCAPAVWCNNPCTRTSSKPERKPKQYRRR